MTDVTTLLAGIKTRAEEATEGPWASYGDLGHEVFRNAGIEDEEPTIAFDIENAADARFIAAARTDVPRLVAALEAVDTIASQMERIANFHIEILGKDSMSISLQAHAEAIRTAVVAALGGGE